MISGLYLIRYALGLAALLALVGFKGYFTVEVHKALKLPPRNLFVLLSIKFTSVCMQASIEFLRTSDLKNSFKTRYFQLLTVVTYSVLAIFCLCFLHEATFNGEIPFNNTLGLQC